MTEVKSVFQLHLEPVESIEIGELTGALSAIESQFKKFVSEQRITDTPENLRLLVSSVKPGSIDINLIPDISAYASVFAPLFDHAGTIVKFAEHIKKLLELFSKSKDAPRERDNITVSDCNDAINIVKPIASHGGSQTFNTIQGPLIQQIVNINAPEAREILETAGREKTRLQYPDSETRQRVSLVWKRIDSDPAKTKGGSSPDKAIIEEIDKKPKAVLFTDDLSYLKTQMIREEDKPFKRVYFVDVQVSRVSGKITAYRVVGYHGSDEIDDEEG